MITSLLATLLAGCPELERLGRADEAAANSSDAGTEDGGVPAAIVDADAGEPLGDRLRPEGAPGDAGADKEREPSTSDAGLLDEHDAGELEPDEQDAGQTAPPPPPPPCTAVFFLDADGDGFGHADSTVTACTRPEGYAEVSGDCYDGNKDAKPGQVAHFSEHRGDGSFDYDCDDAESPRLVAVAECPYFPNSCPPPNHWPNGFSCDYLGMVSAAEEKLEGWHQTVPACGEIGGWSITILWDSSSYQCSIARSQRTQTCR